MSKTGGVSPGLLVINEFSIPLQTSSSSTSCAYISDWKPIKNTASIKNNLLFNSLNIDMFFLIIHQLNSHCYIPQLLYQTHLRVIWYNFVDIKNN